MKRKVIIAYPYWGRGGAEVATMWLIEALKTVYDVTIISRGGFDLDQLNELSSTSVCPNEFHLLKIPCAPLLKKTRLGLIWHSLFLRLVRVYAHNYKICITGSRVINWGKPAIHILSDVEWHPELLEKFSAESTNKHNRKTEIYNQFCTLLRGQPNHKVNNDFYIANSKWTARVSAPYFERTPFVVYPPVKFTTSTEQTTQCKNDFLFLGRISPEKRIEIAIQILQKVKENISDLRFHIAGQFDDSEYSKKILELCKDKNWIVLHGPVYGKKKEELLQQFKYYINARAAEPFGISTVEAIMAGSIPFVFNNGGQTEIVTDKHLTFINEEEAVEKIIHICRTPELGRTILQSLQLSTRKFSSDYFKKSILATVQTIERTL